MAPVKLNQVHTHGRTKIGPISSKQSQMINDILNPLYVFTRPECLCTSAANPQGTLVYRSIAAAAAN